MEDVWPVGTVVSMGPLRVRVEGEVSSTHEELWSRRRWVEPGTGVAASSQTSGVGRSGARWESPAGGLYVSVMSGAGTPAADLDTLGEAASIAALEAALEVVPGAELFVKWPNDIVVRGPRGRVGKVAGVVVRAESGGERVMRAVVSVGLNLAASVEQSDVEAGSMEPASLEGVAKREGLPFDATRQQVLEWLVGFLALHLERARVDPDAVRSRYGAELRRAPLRAKVADVRELFRPVGVARGGALQVRRESGRTAEVSVEDAERLIWTWEKPPKRKPKRAAKRPSPARKRAVSKRKAVATRGRPAKGKAAAKGKRPAKGKGAAKGQKKRSAAPRKPARKPAKRRTGTKPSAARGARAGARR